MSSLGTAFVMYGKIGTERKRPWISSSASPALVSAAFFSFHAALLARLPRSDVFGHTWSPQVKQLIQQLWRPVALRAEPDMSQMLERDCFVRLSPSFNRTNARWIKGVCGRTRSHLLGMTRAIALKRAHEQRVNAVYDAVVVSRWDLAWFGEPLLASWLLAPGLARRLAESGFWLPRNCASYGSDQPDPRMTAACGGDLEDKLLPAGAEQCVHPHRSCQWDLAPATRGLFVLDWFFASSSRNADRFATLTTDDFYNMTEDFEENLGVSRPMLSPCSPLSPLPSPPAETTGPRVGRRAVSETKRQVLRRNPNARPFYLFGHTYWGQWMMHHLHQRINWLPLSLANFHRVGNLPNSSSCQPTPSRLSRLSGAPELLAKTTRRPLTFSAAARDAAHPTGSDFGGSSCPGLPGFNGRSFLCAESSAACLEQADAANASASPPLSHLHAFLRLAPKEVDKCGSNCADRMWSIWGGVAGSSFRTPRAPPRAGG